jgi:hypothetical protein
MAASGLLDTRPRSGNGFLLMSLPEPSKTATTRRTDALVLASLFAYESDFAVKQTAFGEHTGLVHAVR